MVSKAAESELDAYTIRHTVTVPRPPGEAFVFFTERLSDWWPAAYTWAQDVLEEIAMEPKVDGRCFERGPHGFTCDWGRVLVWEPPLRLEFSWQISPGREPVPNPAKASEVEVRFTAEDAATTRVTLEHRHLDRHGEGGEEYRSMLASEQGWPYILACYVTAVSPSP